MANRTRSKKRSKNKKSRKMYMQRGGVFTEEQEDLLFNESGFNQEQVDFLNQNNVSFQNIQTATNYVLDNNQHTIACFIASCLQNEDNNQNPQNEMAPDLNIDDLQGEGEDDPAFNDAFIQDDNNAELNNSGVTDPEQGSFSFDEEDGDGDDGDDELGLNDQDNNQAAGKRRTRKGRKGKKTRKQRGGMRYGTGVGSNCFDPNFSIYNTPTLSLFPYKPN